jgi:hypothetical protein
MTLLAVVGKSPGKSPTSAAALGDWIGPATSANALSSARAPASNAGIP